MFSLSYTDKDGKVQIIVDRKSEEEVQKTAVNICKSQNTTVTVYKKLGVLKPSIVPVFTEEK